MAKRPKRRMNLPVVMAVVLFYLTVFSTYLTAGLYAKYIVKDSGSDAARVVKFGNVSVTETGTFTEKDGKKQFIYQPGADLTKDVKISFTSAETDVYIFAALETPGWAKAADSNQFTDTAEIGMSWAVDTAAGWQ
ncbi:MAG: hypothetical protein IJD80_07655, partial [Oscillospiraceae bacterium]|nr:hypothetical protein [Oscillospiraceae bacterium]